MGVLTGLEPAAVFHYFEEICAIPHGSGNESRLSDYIREFAKKRNLACIQDEWKNIIIVKEASKGYEAEETIILQGHMDMVAVKEPDCDIDMSKEPLRLEIKDGFVTAKGTSLGGDDGIAVAYALALLDSEDILHPRLEVVLTVGEETGMDGAREIDLSMIKGKRMLNLDNEEEGVLLTSCAGGARVDCRLPIEVEKRRGALLHLRVDGLQGGHSGAEIIKEGGNSNCLMARVLDALIQRTSAALVSMEGGLADNAIPICTDACIIVEKEEAGECFTIIEDMNRKIQDELALKDAGAAVFIVEKGKDEPVSSVCPENMSREDLVSCLSKESMKKVAAYLMSMPNGIQAMSADVEGLVETSLNLGIMKLTDEHLLLGYSIRSSIQSSKEALIRKMESISALAGAQVDVRGDYPGWAYRHDSPLRNKMVGIYEEMYGKSPRIQAIHAGLECGLISDKISGLDCISYGPDMHDIHTTKEALSISSVKRVWEYLLEILKRK